MQSCSATAGWVLNMGGRTAPSYRQRREHREGQEVEVGSTWYDDLKKKDPQLAAATPWLVVNQPMFALKNMVGLSPP